MLRRPEKDEYDPYFERYLSEVHDEDILAGLERRLERTLARLSSLDEERGALRYAPGKWSVKQVVGHLADAERLFGARALGFARGTEAPWPGIDPDRFAAAAGHDRLALADLLAAYRLARLSNLALFREFDDQAWVARGRVDDAAFSTRTIPYLLAAHEDHHLAVLSQRYGID